MKQFGALLKSKGLGVPLIVTGVDLAKPDSDVSAVSAVKKLVHGELKLDPHAFLSVDTTVIPGDSIKASKIKEDQVYFGNIPIQDFKWGTIDDVKPPLPDPHDIPIELALNALQNHGLGIKEVTWNHGWDQWPTVTLEIAVHGSADQIKQTMTALQGWVITKGKY